MTANRRIALNVVATYGRSVYAMLCGLFTSRWVLMALGEVDYGLVWVVGGLTGFISFLNGLMAESLVRFYAYAVGAARVEKDSQKGLEECRKWFSIAVAIHTVLPALLIIVEEFITNKPNFGIAAILLSMTGTMLLTKYIKLKKNYYLIFSVLELAVAAAFIILHIIQLVG